MFDQIVHLIKQDEESQNEFKEFIRVNNENVKMAESKMLKRTRRVALTLGFIFILMIMAFVFGWVTKIKYDKDIRGLESQLNDAKLELTECLNSSN